MLVKRIPAGVLFFMCARRAYVLTGESPNPPGSGKDTAQGKGVIMRWGLKEAGGKTLT